MVKTIEELSEKEDDEQKHPSLCRYSMRVLDRAKSEYQCGMCGIFTYDGELHTLGDIFKWHKLQEQHRAKMFHPK